MAGPQGKKAHTKNLPVEVAGMAITADSRLQEVVTKLCTVRRSKYGRDKYGREMCTVRRLLTSSPVVTSCWLAMVSIIMIGVSMYGAKLVKVVQRMSVLTAPILARKAVVRVLPAKMKSLCLVTAKRWMLTTAEVALMAWAAG